MDSDLPSRLIFTFAGIVLPLLVFSQPKNAPDWVHSPPYTSGAFYGIGISQTKNNPQYRAIARKIALRDIAEKIFVSISSETNLNTTYQNDEVEYLLSEKISMGSNNFLTGYYLKEDWLDRKGEMYYALFVLSEEKYQANRYEYFAGIEQLSRTKMESADDFYSSGDLIQGMIRFSEVVEDLNEELSHIIEPQYRNLLAQLRYTGLSKLEAGMRRVSFDLDDQYRFSVESAQPLMISDFLRDNVTGSPLKQFRTEINILHGDVFRHAFMQEEAGHQLVVYGVYPVDQSALIQIEVELPLQSLTLREAGPFHNRITSKPISLYFQPYGVSMDEIGNESGDQLLEGFIETIINDLGLTIDAPNPLYQLNIESDQQLSYKERLKYYSSYDATITIIRPSDNRHMFRYDFDAKIASSVNPDRAIESSFSKTVRNDNDFLNSLITFLCGYQLE